MKLIPVTSIIDDDKALQQEFNNARQIGVVRLGETCLFFRSKLKQYYVPYGDIKKCYRRVMMVPLKMCCGNGDLMVENLVIEDDNKELAVVQLPGTKAAKALMDDLKKLIPDADFSSPKRDEEGEIIGDSVQAEGAAS